MIIPTDGGVLEEVRKCCRNCGTLASPPRCKETSQVVGQTEPVKTEKEHKSQCLYIKVDCCRLFTCIVFFFLEYSHLIFRFC